MARGKQAALSATRRAEAAHEVIDRLTDQLAEAKRRAREHEAASVRLPVALAEIDRLRTQNEQGTSDSLEAERSRRDAAIADRDERLLALARLLMQGDPSVRLTTDQFAEVVRLVGRPMSDIVPNFKSRTARRQTSTAKRLVATAQARTEIDAHNGPLRGR